MLGYPVRIAIEHAMEVSARMLFARGGGRIILRSDFGVELRSHQSLPKDSKEFVAQLAEMNSELDRRFVWSRVDAKPHLLCYDNDRWLLTRDKKNYEIFLDSDADKFAKIEKRILSFYPVLTPARPHYKITEIFLQTAAKLLPQHS